MHFWPEYVTVIAYEWDCIGSLYVTSPKVLSFGVLGIALKVE
jgi:hypothetical protein